MKYIRNAIGLTFMFCVFYTSAQNEVLVASMKQDGTLQVEKRLMDELPAYSFRSAYSQLEGFPFGKLAHPNFKNFRNVTLADLDGDGQSEIVVCMNETLYAIHGDGSLMWSTTLSGTSNFPPAIADIDGDGDMEIAVQTYSVPSTGNVYLFNHEGQLQPGWPLNIDNHFFLNGITLADIDNDGDLEILASERINSASGRIHALRKDSHSVNAQWPVNIPGTPAFTPSVGDINQDGFPEIVTASTSALYLFTSEGLAGNNFPVMVEGSKFSYQSPLLADLNGNGMNEIIGARHGDLPGTYVLDAEGNDYGLWPDYDSDWTFATPAVADVDGDGDFEIFFGRPYFSESNTGAILLGYDHEGNAIPGFPILGLAGSEGVIAIADMDGDGDMELVTSSKVTIDGKGLIFAYHTESGLVAEGFPLQVEGFTYLNGGYLGDVNGDGLLDITALSYQTKFDANNPDSAFINVFNLEIPYKPETILFNGYKGSNSHTGYFNSQSNAVEDFRMDIEAFECYPNPAHQSLKLKGKAFSDNCTGQIFSLDGRIVSNISIQDNSIFIGHLSPGNYVLFIDEHQKKYAFRFVKE